MISNKEEYAEAMDKIYDLFSYDTLSDAQDEEFDVLIEAVWKYEERNLKK